MQRKIIKRFKGLYLRADKRKRLSPAASITVEASLVLPLFMFFFINILGVFDILSLQCDLTAALHQTGSRIMESAGVSRVSPADDKEGILGVIERAGIAAYADSKVKSYFNDNEITHSCLTGGTGGISLAESALGSDGDIIDLVAKCRVHPVFGIARFTDFSVESRFYGHAFTGYDLSGASKDDSDSEELVYITETGSVYHRSLSCSHLKLTIEKVSLGSLSSRRNEDGAKYYPCDICGKRAGGAVYITSFGNRYHSTTTCSGIKRSIRTVPISEVGGRRACKDCG